MSKDKPHKTVKRIKTGSIERRWSVASAGMRAGSRAATHLWMNALTPKEKRLSKRSKMLSEQARYLVGELGKLKGSVVKIGQMMALYGEHVLPDEVTTAFRQLEENTIAVDWPVMEQVLKDELGADALAKLDVEPVALAAASLGQVHRARRKSDGCELCLKIQYPGVSEAIDSDLDAVASLLRWTKIVSVGAKFDDWLDEIHAMLYREINYRQEADTTQHFGELLAGDKRFIVPHIFSEFCTDRVIAMSFEPGLAVNSDLVAALPQKRRNALGEAFLDLFNHEVFDWGELQTDPNFGNYRIRPKSGKDQTDRIVLLDFGAVKKFPDDFLHALRQMVIGAQQHQHELIINGAIALNMMQAEYPQEVLEAFAELCIALIEPLNYREGELPEQALNKQNAYRWAHSNLPRRVAKQASKAAYSKYFAIPPGEFTFLSRKLLGVYNLIAALDAEFDPRDSLAPWR